MGSAHDGSLSQLKGRAGPAAAQFPNHENSMKEMLIGPSWPPRTPRTRVCLPPTLILDTQTHIGNFKDTG